MFEDQTPHVYFTQTTTARQLWIQTLFSESFFTPLVVLLPAAFICP